jgi:hypothetical protein
MPNIINRGNFADFNNNLEIVWRKSYESFPKRAGQLYDMEDVSVDTGDESGLDGFSVAKKKREGGDFSFLSVTQNYRKSWTVYEIGGETKITWLMRKAAKYRNIQDKISKLAESAAKRMEWDLTHRFTFATATSYTDLDGDTVTTTVGDGLALLSTAHTVPGSATTYRNRVANNPILSKGGLEAAEKLFATQMIDTNGELIFQEPTHLVIPNDPNTINTAIEYLRSYADPTAAHEGVKNVYEGKYQLLVLPYLATTAAGVYDSTKAKYWFLVNLNHKDAVVKVLEQPTFIPPSAADGVEFETMDWKYACHAAYAIEIIDPRFVVGSLGDASA